MKKSAELGDEREVKLKGISGSESVFYKTVSDQHVWLKLQNLVFLLVTISSVLCTLKREALLGVFGDTTHLGTGYLKRKINGTWDALTPPLQWGVSSASFFMSSKKCTFDVCFHFFLDCVLFLGL